MLANTYHLMLRPGAERIARLGGLHRFMRWDRPILTDSGGFQVMSLAKLRKITDDGVAFQSHIDGASHLLTPERAIEIQCLLGADIQMQLDECVALPAAREEIERAVDRSLAWAERCKRAFAEPRQARARPCSASCRAAPMPACARAPPTRWWPWISRATPSAAWRSGKAQAAMLDTLELTARRLPARQAALSHGRRHAARPDRGGGARRRHVRLRPADPLRPARPGLHLGRQGQPQERRATPRMPAPLDPASSCPAARDYSRAYLHHLVKSQEYLAAMLLSWANVAFYQELMAAMRAAIAEGRFAAWAAETKARLSAEPSP